MNFHLNPDAVVTPIVVLLRADTTLQAAGYLNGTNKVFSGRLPDAAVLPAVCAQAPTVQMDDGTQWMGEIRLYCYTTLLSNGQVDPKGNTILARCEELLADESVTVSGMTVQNFFSLGIIPSFFDSQTDKSKARGVLRLRATLGYN